MGSLDTASFGEVVHIMLPIDCDDLVRVPSDRPALIILWQDGRPVAQQWHVAGQPVEPGLRQFGEHLALPPAHLPRRPAPTSVSVVICTRDRSQELSRCLASMAMQTRRPDETIVVDNASRDQSTRDVALAAGVTYVRDDRPGLDFARNTGAITARSEIVAYTDDDTELDPRWLELLALAFDSDQIIAVTGLVLPAKLATEAQWLFERGWGFGRGFQRIDYDQHFYHRSRRIGCPAWKVGAGANMAFRRSIFLEIGLFDERLDVGAAGCSGDSEYWYRVLAAGYTCRYEPTAVVYHHHRLTMDGLKRQIFHYMRGHVAALMVQYERTGDRGNLRRAFLTMPNLYARLAANRLIRGRSPRNRLLWQQVSGSIAGLYYYLRAPRPSRLSAECNCNPRH